ncbi:MAG: M36 family metallopeptidase [Ahniella sp.]|nr:M36 family metallopeptidase [Ahniella sp.]
MVHVRPHRIAMALALSLGLALPTAHAAVRADGRIPFLTGAQEGEAKSLALDYLGQNRSTLGLTEADVAEMEIRDDYATRHNGVRHIYWRQVHEGIEVWNGDIAINVARDGSIINLHNGFVPNLAAKADVGRVQLIDAGAAIAAAAADLGLESRSPMTRTTPAQGRNARQVWAWAGISADPIPVRLVYQPSLDRQSVRLVWDLVIRETEGSGWWSMRVDAETGEVLDRTSWVAHVEAGHQKGGPFVQYRVYPFPAESAVDTTHQLVSDPSDPLASPFGWHDTNGVAGVEFTDTRGNNVSAQDDLDANDSGGFRPTGSGVSPLVFDFAHTPAVDPATGSNLSASIVSLFYWNNIMHDLTYQYGFDEAGGNFQVNNYGRGGAGSDGVQADAIDGSGTNNANFGTPPDGAAPRMQMFRWSAPAEVFVTAPAALAGSYLGVPAAFGAVIDAVGVTGDMQLVNDGAGVSNTDMCEAMAAGSLAGKIALVDRGNCEFGLKGLNAQNAGATGMVVVNNTAAPPGSMGPGANGAAVTTLRAVMVSQADGNLFRAQLPSPGVSLSLRKAGADRDSDFDAGIIGHEYGHGISNRLTGGPSNTSCLGTNIGGGQTSEQAGEGWSDFWALVMHAKPGDTALTPRFIGTFSAFQPAATGPGIRNFPYSTVPAVSPQTYANVSATNAPHGVGEIWAGAVWNLYWQLVNQYGYSSNLYTGTGGNNLTIQLVIDGMKLQPCQPTMVQARDAIIAADQANNTGANVCSIWRAFAAKGLGTGAVGGTFARGDEVASSTIPPQCELSFVFADGFED